MNVPSAGYDYLALVINSATVVQNGTAILSLFFLCLGRIAPIIILSPFFGAKISPGPMKMVLAISLFVIFLPKLVQITTTPLLFDLHLLILFVKELFVGFAIGLMINMPFFIVQGAGIIIDNQRGGASLMTNDPTIQNQSSPLGTFFNLLLIYIFFVIQGPFLLIDAIIDSYDILPPDQLLGKMFFSQDNPFWKVQMDLLNRMMILTIQLSSPGLIMILMTDSFLGIANRLAPQVQISFLGMPLKSLLALTVVAIGLRPFTDQLVIELHTYFNVMKEMIHGLSFGR